MLGVFVCGACEVFQITVVENPFSITKGERMQCEIDIRLLNYFFTINKNTWMIEKWQVGNMCLSTCSIRDDITHWLFPN